MSSPSRTSTLSASLSTPCTATRPTSSPGPARHVSHVAAIAKVSMGHQLGPWIHPTRDISERVMQRAASPAACGGTDGGSASLNKLNAALDRAAARSALSPSASPRSSSTACLPRALATGGRGGSPAPAAPPGADAEELLGTNAWAESLAQQEAELRQMLPLIEKSLAHWHPSMVCDGRASHLTPTTLPPIVPMAR